MRRPGSLYGVLLAAGLCGLAGPRSGAAAAPTNEPGPVEIPAVLRARVPMLEMSGLAWSATLDRYLVVIDDSIDDQEGTRHGPFVLALARDGKVDSEPVPVVGVDQIDDAESITAGPDDTFYLLTSHSPNRRGRIHKARCELLALKLENRKLVVTGAINLLRGRHDLTEELVALGLPESTTVDLEAIGYHDGTLYIGCKAPLLPDGSALILRLDRVAEAFARGRLLKHGLAAWGQVKLAVPSPTGGLVSEGIADLFFATDGALYLCANSPKGAAEKDGGGTLWRVADQQGGRMKADLVHRFSKLKPEGVTAAPDGKALTLVFDRDRLDPLWMRLPLGR
jgi:hypothetical protein